jgi:hypothetical protein
VKATPDPVIRQLRDPPDVFNDQGRSPVAALKVSAGRAPRNASGLSI